MIFLIIIIFLNLESEYGRGHDSLCGENEEYDEDLQKAIFSSIDNSYENSGTEIGSLSMFNKKMSTNSIDVLSVLAGRLEDISRRIYDQMLVAKTNLKGNDTIILYYMWNELQTTIGNGFPFIYSLREQKDILISFIKNPNGLIHMIPGISIGFSNERILASLVSDIIESKYVTPRLNNNNNSNNNSTTTNNSNNMKEDINSNKFNQITIQDIAMTIQNFHCLNLCPTGILNDLKLNHPPITNKILSTSFELIQSLLVNILLRKITSGISSINDKNSLDIKSLSTEITNFFNIINKCINEELNEILTNLPLYSELIDANNLSQVFENTITTSLLSNFSSLFTNINYLNIDNSMIFLPSAFQLVNIFNNFLISSKSLPTFIQSNVFDWIHREMRWILLYLSSTIGLCLRAGLDGNLNDEKYYLSSFYESSSQNIINIEEICRQHQFQQQQQQQSSSQQYHSKIFSTFQNWKWIIDWENIIDVQNHKKNTSPSITTSTTTTSSTSPFLNLLIESLSTLVTNIISSTLTPSSSTTSSNPINITTSSSQIIWLRNYFNFISHSILEYFQNDLEKLLIILQLEEVDFSIIVWDDIMDQFDHNILIKGELIFNNIEKDIVTNIKDYLLTLKLTIFTLLLIFTGHSTNISQHQVHVINHSGLIEIWIATILIVSTLFKKYLSLQNITYLTHGIFIAFFFFFFFSKMICFL